MLANPLSALFEKFTFALVRCAALGIPLRRTWHWRDCSHRVQIASRLHPSNKRARSATSCWSRNYTPWQFFKPPHVPCAVTFTLLCTPCAVSGLSSRKAETARAWPQIPVCCHAAAADAAAARQPMKRPARITAPEEDTLCPLQHALGLRAVYRASSGSRSHALRYAFCQLRLRHLPCSNSPLGMVS